MPGQVGPGIKTPGLNPIGPGPFDFKPAKGVGPLLLITGTTRDSTGAALGTCDVKLIRTRDNAVVDELTSAADGSFTFQTPSPNETYFLVAYLSGSPDVAGTSLKTLVGA